MTRKELFLTIALDIEKLGKKYWWPILYIVVEPSAGIKYMRRPGEFLLKNVAGESCYLGSSWESHCNSGAALIVRFDEGLLEGVSAKYCFIEYDAFIELSFS